MFDSVIFYTLERYEEYILEKYNMELQCGDSEVYGALQQGQERVLEQIDYDCYYCFSCCCTKEVIEEAIYIYAYFYMFVYNVDEDDTYKELERTTYRFLKNRGCLNA